VVAWCRDAEISEIEVQVMKGALMQSGNTQLKWMLICISLLPRLGAQNIIREEMTP
jgi:hypothetical protein